jgi:hypothetical protein
VRVPGVDRGRWLWHCALPSAARTPPIAAGSGWASRTRQAGPPRIWNPICDALLLGELPVDRDVEVAGLWVGVSVDRSLDCHAIVQHRSRADRSTEVCTAIGRVARGWTDDRAGSARMLTARPMRRALASKRPPKTTASLPCRTRPVVLAHDADRKISRQHVHAAPRVRFCVTVAIAIGPPPARVGPWSSSTGP